MVLNLRKELCYNHKTIVTAPCCLVTRSNKIFLSRFSLFRCAVTITNNLRINKYRIRRRILFIFENEEFTTSNFDIFTCWNIHWISITDGREGTITLTNVCVRSSAQPLLIHSRLCRYVLYNTNPSSKTCRTTTRGIKCIKALFYPNVIPLPLSRGFDNNKLCFKVEDHSNLYVLQ